MAGASASFWITLWLRGKSLRVLVWLPLWILAALRPSAIWAIISLVLHYHEKNNAGETDMDTLQHLVDYGVIWLLICLSIWSVAVAIERWLTYRRINLREFDDVRRLEIALTKRLVVIGTVAANAPYIGLLGTVLGIMLTFHSMGTAKTIAVSTIMVGLSLALKATAVGLLVAIPCVALNNALRRKVTELVTEYKASHGS